MIRTPLTLAAAGLVLAVATPTPASGQSAVLRSAYHDYRVVPVAEGLEHPWSIAFRHRGCRN